MEKHILLIQKAISYLKEGERALTFTYPLVKENKVLLGVVNNLFLANTNAMGAILQYEALHKNIDSVDESFEQKYQQFKLHIIEKYHIDPGYLRLTRDLKDIIIAHQNSPIEFSRGDKFIICQENYELKEISKESLKKAYEKTKLFIDEVSLLIHHERGNTSRK